MTTYRTLHEANAARQALWQKPGQPLDVAYRANELAGEAGEALDAWLKLFSAVGKVSNTAKKLERERRGLVGSRIDVDSLADELGDVAICADLVALGEGIHLDAVVAHKFNLTSRKLGFDVYIDESQYTEPKSADGDDAQLILAAAKAMGISVVMGAGRHGQVTCTPRQLVDLCAAVAVEAIAQARAETKEAAAHKAT